MNVRFSTRGCVSAGLLLGLLFSAPAALAEPAFARLWKTQYGYSPSCNACHKDGGGTPVNDYGAAFKDAGMNAGAFSAIAARDDDGDGFANGDEAAAKANPGSARSTPDEPGEWLDINNLVPAAVRARFETATAYKPIDAILTESEFKRAAAKGVTLTPEDETTIYVAVEDKRPIGTAIIVPGEFEGQQYFVVLSTDRKLNVTGAGALEGGSVDAAEDPALYASVIGTPIAELPAAEGDDLAAAVTNTVKKAGTLLLVRLKKS